MEVADRVGGPGASFFNDCRPLTAEPRRNGLPDFRIVDLRPDRTTQEHLVEADTPEGAAEAALHEKFTRAGHRRNLACRVYWRSINNINMVRLYRRTSESAKVIGETTH